MGQITSADNGTNVPGNDGFAVDGDAIFSVVGGTNISATLQTLTTEGNWVDVPDPDGFEQITGAWMRPIAASSGDRFRFAIATATGTWDWSQRPRKR